MNDGGSLTKATTKSRPSEGFLTPTPPVPLVALAINSESS